VSKDTGILNENQGGTMSQLTHLDAEGNARMVDVGDKEVTAREAVARGQIRMAAETLRLIREGNLKKGDVLTVAQIAGIQAAKRTHELIPMCHPLLLNHVSLTFTLNDALPGVEIEGRVKVSGKTGVEMEALTAVSVAALTIYDMAKAVDREMVIEHIHLAEKRGGKSGEYIAPST
jgi:cyclic pyranopterin monophosphate synthase